jgi:hypothetical protein
MNFGDETTKFRAPGQRRSKKDEARKVYDLRRQTSNPPRVSAEVRRAEVRRRFCGLVRFDGAYGDGVIFLGSGNGGFCARLFVESRQSGLVAGFKNVDFVAYDQGILRAF